MFTEEQLYYQKLSKPHKGRGAQQRHVEKFRLKKNEEVQSLLNDYISFAKNNLLSSLSCTSFVDTGLYNNKIIIKTRNYCIQHPIDQEYIESLKPYIETFNLAAESAPIYAKIQQCPPINESLFSITRYQPCTQFMRCPRGYSVSLDRTISVSFCDPGCCCYPEDYDDLLFIQKNYKFIVTSMAIYDFLPLPIGNLPEFGLDCIVILSPRAYLLDFHRGKDGIYSTNHVAFGEQYVPTGSILITDRHDVYLHACRSHCYGIIHCPPSDQEWCTSVKRYPGYHYITDREMKDFIFFDSVCWDCENCYPHVIKRQRWIQHHNEIETNSQTVIDQRQSAWKST